MRALNTHLILLNIIETWKEIMPPSTHTPIFVYASTVVLFRITDNSEHHVLCVLRNRTL